jgi:hypothetical protein
MLYQIEDEAHADPVSNHKTEQEARQELERIALIPWGTAPNRVPCSTGDDCERVYEIVTFDDNTKPYWTELRRERCLTVTKAGAVWQQQSR